VIAADGERAQARVDAVVQRQGPTTNEGDTPATLTVGGRYDLEFIKFATGWRITKCHTRTRYTIGKPSAVERARGLHHA
jgi:SnoaL-like domain